MQRIEKKNKKIKIKTPHNLRIELPLGWIQLHPLECLQILNPTLQSLTKGHSLRSPSWQETPVTVAALQI